MQSNFKIAFFGTPEFAVSILNELKRGNITPELIVTNPDEPKGRKLIITPPPAKIWATEHNIPAIQPENLKTKPGELKDSFDLFIVAAYGKLIPDEILNTPKHGTINVHPSLLPKYRGPSPVQATILNGDTETGVSIMLLDKEMDHGPIIAQETYNLTTSHLYLPELKERLAEVAGRMLCKLIPDWIAGKIKAIPQSHTEASFTKKISKDDGFVPNQDLLDLDLSADRANQIERMVRALNPDPGVFTYFETNGKKMRVKITRARVELNKLIIEKVIPEGKKEMSWEDFKRGNKI